jgi:hypothetical protein
MVLIDTMYLYCHHVCSLLPSHEKISTNKKLLCNMYKWGERIFVPLDNLLQTTPYFFRCLFCYKYCNIFLNTQVFFSEQKYFGTINFCQMSENSGV